jgi:hypothetical protein
LVEEAVLKTVGCKRLRGSSPFFSAKEDDSSTGDERIDYYFLFPEKKIITEQVHNDDGYEKLKLVLKK